MTAAQGGLREHLRAASEALSRANALATNGGSPLDEVRQRLLQAARKHIAIAASASLQATEASGLPGLPTNQSGDAEAKHTMQTALASAWNCLAELERLRGDKGAGIAAYQRVIELAPSDITANAQLAELLESRHDLAAAKTHAEAALRLDAGNFAAGLALTRVLLREERFADAERTALAAATAPRAIPDEHALAWSLVGEARDRLGHTKAAFEAFTQGNQLMRQRYGDMQQRSHPAQPANVRSFTRFVSTSNAALWRAPSSFATPAPAFLIGFPRSGTTLIEQVLAAHPRVICLDETDHLFEALSVVLRDGDVLDRIATLAPDEIAAAREAYWRVVLADHPEASGRLVVDKHPLHIVLLPLIHKIFPDAKIAYAERDPRDVVLSCYQQCFGINVATAQFLDLRRAAEYYDAVMELMSVCREKLRLDLHEVAYRDVVADLDREAHRLAGFLGVPFDPAMLRYNETARARAVSSASARQVINPIYDRSIGRWRRYARELAPVLPSLNAWARRLGYDV